MNVQDQKEAVPDEPAGECHTIEHTADIGVCCRAPTLERLFECAGHLPEMVVGLFYAVYADSHITKSGVFDLTRYFRGYKGAV